MATITSITNNIDGTTATAIIANPVGSIISFTASRTVNQTGVPITSSLLSTNTYTLTFPVSAYLYGNSISYWVAVSDDNGTSIQSPIWISYGSNTSIGMQVATTLQSILVQNKPLLDYRLAQYSTNGTAQKVQQILVGMGAEAVKFPVIDISATKFKEEIGWGIPNSNVVDITASILVFAFHQGDLSWRNLITTLSFTVRDILNQLQYVQYTLPSGLEWVLGGCRDIDIQELFNNNAGRFEMTGDIAWNGQILVGMS